MFIATEMQEARTPPGVPCRGHRLLHFTPAGVSTPPALVTINIALLPKGQRQTEVCRTSRLLHALKPHLEKLHPLIAVRRELTCFEPLILFAQVHRELDGATRSCDGPLHRLFLKRFQIGVDVTTVGSVGMPPYLLRVVIIGYDREGVVNDRAFFPRILALAQAPGAIHAETGQSALLLSSAISDCKPTEQEDNSRLSTHEQPTFES